MAYGFQTRSANGAILFDSNNENMFFHSKATFANSTQVDFPDLAGKTLVAIPRAIESTGYIAQSWTVNQLYIAGIPRFTISFKADAQSRVEVLFFYSNRPN